MEKPSRELEDRLLCFVFLNLAAFGSDCLCGWIFLGGGVGGSLLKQDSNIVSWKKLTLGDRIVF